KRSRIKPGKFVQLLRSTRSEREGNSEVVQRGQGLWLHPALQWRGRLRTFQRHPGARLSHPERGRDGRVRSAEGPQGVPSGERGPRRLSPRNRLENQPTVNPSTRKGFSLG